MIALELEHKNLAWQTWYSTICSFWIDIWFYFSVWDYLVLTVFQLTLCQYMSAIRNFSYRFFFDPFEKYITVDFFITYCFMPFAFLSLLVLTAGCYTLPYSVRYCWSCFKLKDYDITSSFSKSCSFGQANRRGRNWNRNHIWWTRTRTRSPSDNSNNYCRWNWKRKFWEFKNERPTTHTSSVSHVESWFSFLYSLFLSDIFLDCTSLLIDTYLFPLDLVRFLYSSCTVIYQYWCPWSNAYSFTFISSLLHYGAFIHDCDKYMPNGPIFPNYSSTSMDQFLSSFHVVYHMKTCANLASFQSYWPIKQFIFCQI